jgi:gliding motility-associated-like protein
MRSMFRLYFLIAFMGAGLLAISQNLSNKGKEFWVGYGHHQFFESGTNSQEMVLYLSAEQPANVTITINGTAYAQSYYIPANTVIASAPIPKTGTYDCRLFSGAPGFSGIFSEGTSDRGIHIISDVPIVAYAHIYGSASSGATMLMPVETYGYSYVTINSQQRYQNNCFSWVYVIAKENNTRVEITPSAPTRAGRAADLPFTVTLNKGQVYQLLGAISSGSIGYDLTGTKVKSIANAAGKCFPIAVFAGSSRTYITCSFSGGGGGDNIIQQIFPFQAWGKRYLTAPTSNAGSANLLSTNMYRIAVKDPSTVVKLNGVALSGLISNTYYEYQSGTADYIEADKPIMVAQYMSSNGGCPNTSGNGDPEMMYISPIEQSIKRVGFYRNTREAIVQNYLTLIIPTAGISTLTIDGVGASGFSYSYAHPNLPGYTVVVKRWNATQAQCIVQSDFAFSAITYGMGNVESYGYNAGTLINNLNVFGNVHNTADTIATSNQFTCRNTPAEIGMLVAYKPTTMLWQLSQVPLLSPNADVFISNPVPADSVFQNGVWYYKYDLPGTYSFKDTGSIQIPVLNTNPAIENCNNSEVVNFNIIVKSAPVADFSLSFTGCILDSVHFNSTGSTLNNFNVANWKWTFDDGSSLIGQNPVKRFSSAGPQNIKLDIISSEGCIGDTTRSITIFDKPSAFLKSSIQTLCEGSSVTFTDSSAYAGTAPINTWFWDFGNAPAVNNPNGTAQTITYPTYGTYTVKHLVKVSNTCISDTAVQVINVFANPKLSLSYPAGCLPPDGIVQFTNNTSIGDAQPLSYNWNFGDAASSAGNPNTSTQQSPSHIYTLGTYTIKYGAATPNGCFRDTTFTTTFNVRAQLAYPKLNSVCESVKIPVSVALGTVTNSVAGRGIYKGPGTDTLGNFRPSQAGAGIHTIWYVYTSNGGCRDSISSTIKVLPKPVSNFNISADICQGQSASITDASTLINGNIVRWNWNFGDGNTASYTNGNSFTRNYPGFNNYTVKLFTESDSSCFSDTVTKTIAVHALPVADFRLPAFICMPDGNGTFTNQTTIGDNAALSYQWNFGDNSTVSTSVSPIHKFTSNGPFSIQLTATSAFGCKNDTTKVLSIFYDQPIAAFRVSPDTLCQGANNVFTDLSTAPNSTVQSWSWNFGDGSTSATKNPVKKYALPGNFLVSLTVKNAVGCSSDPFTGSVLVYLQPVINAGPSFVVPEGTVITFNPTANDSMVLKFLWTPAGDFSDPTQLRPAIQATHNQSYMLTATGQGNCTAADSMSVKILKPVHVPNAFSPNGDGINDTWQIPNLADYPGCSVEIYNRYGQLVYQSYGYGTPWNGTYKGNPLPFATYYYVIVLKNGFRPVTGSVTIVK